MFSELIVLLPCHSLEDFPVHHQGAEAEGLLAAWSALWHPALLASAQNLPIWFRADAPPDELGDRLIIVPEASESLLLTGWTTRAKDEGALVLRKLQRRQDMVDAALAAFDKPNESEPEQGPSLDKLDPELVRDFFALGTGYLLVELLTRQMRYMSNLDEIQLKRAAVDAANACMAGDAEETRRHLTTAFEVLAEARDRFYPVHCYLIDLTLVAPTTLGQSLRDDLNGDTPTNVLMSASVLEECAKREPATIESLKLALDHKRVSLIGGEYEENELPLMPREAVVANLERGIETYEQIVGQRPTVFGRRRFGLTPILPLVLGRMDFNAVLHFTLDDGQFPHGPQAKTRWEGIDMATIDALCRVPLDAATHETMLSFSSTMGESMDGDHVATVVFAHWPGQVSPFYDDLRRTANYGTPLGRFITLDEYFSSTDSPGELSKFKLDKYRSPYLQQAIIKQQADALSRHCVEYETAYVATQNDALTTMAAMAAGGEVAENSSQSNPVERLAQVARRGGKARGMFVANGHSFGRTALVDVSRLTNVPEVEGPVVAVQETSGAKWAVVEVPACGFAWLTAGATRPTARAAKRAKPMAEDNLLRNELFEVTVHQTTGGIRSIHAASARGNRVSQQLAFRLPPIRQPVGTLWRDPDEDAVYSVMCLDSMEVTSPGPSFGEIVTRGRLMSPEGSRLAGYTQTLRLVRGSSRLEMEVDLDIAELPRADAWNSYYASRFAWSDESAELLRSVSSTAQQTTARRIEAPEFLDIRSERTSTTLFFGGLPYHRRTSDRMLDTLLVVRGESRRKFRMAIAIDSSRPAHESADLMAPVVALDDVALASAQNGSGWLFHLDARSILATHWRPIVDGSVTGFRVRLLETQGRAGRATLRTFKSPQSARQIDFRGQTLVALSIEEDRVGVDLVAYEWIEIEVIFGSG